MYFIGTQTLPDAIRLPPLPDGVVFLYRQIIAKKAIGLNFYI